MSATSLQALSSFMGPRGGSAGAALRKQAPARPPRFLTFGAPPQVWTSGLAVFGRPRPSVPSGVIRLDLPCSTTDHFLWCCSCDLSITIFPTRNLAPESRCDETVSIVMKKPPRNVEVQPFLRDSTHIDETVRDFGPRVQSRNLSPNR